ncbi:hypothetical protein ABEW34_31165 [Paenibacillus algorifonticola]|uniref:hypothetical protein n=1 Tax=Paenibacillus algorifonticola TaxID=684063 RepID=UPI003D2CDEF7
MYLTKVLEEIREDFEDNTFKSVVKGLYSTGELEHVEYWIKLNNSKQHLLMDILNETALNNEQATHLTTYLIDTMDSNLDVAKIINIGVEKLNQDSSLSGILETILNQKDLINSFYSEDNLQELFEVILNSLVEVNLLNYKREFTEWLKEAKAGGNTIIKTVKKLEYSNDDLEILAEKFPRSKRGFSKLM